MPAETQSNRRPRCPAQGDRRDVGEDDLAAETGDSGRRGPGLRYGDGSGSGGRRVGAGAGGLGGAGEHRQKEQEGELRSHGRGVTQLACHAQNGPAGSMPGCQVFILTRILTVTPEQAAPSYWLRGPRST